MPFTFVCFFFFFFFFFFFCCCCCCCCFVCLCGCCHSDDCFPSFQPILYPHPFPNKTKREREKQEQTNKQKRAIIVTNAYPSTIKWFLPVEMFSTWKSKCLYTLPFSMLPCFVQCYPAMSNVTLPCYNYVHVGFALVKFLLLRVKTITLTATFCITMPRRNLPWHTQIYPVILKLTLSCSYVSLHVQTYPAMLKPTPPPPCSNLPLHFQIHPAMLKLNQPCWNIPYHFQTHSAMLKHTLSLSNSLCHDETYPISFKLTLPCWNIP